MADQTYSKSAVVAAANATIQKILADRTELVAQWDSKSIITRILLGMIAESRPTYYHNGWQETAERILFKATYCMEATIALTDHEIDVVKNCWGQP